MTVGFVGPARIDDTVVDRLVRSGHAVTVLTTLHGQHATPPTGARPATTLADLCRQANVVVTSDQDDAELLQLAQHDGGLAASMIGGATHVALGVHRPDTIAQIARAHETRGQRLVSAAFLLPTSDGASPIVVAAGTAPAMEAAAPLFDALGITVFAAGELASAAPTLALIHAGLAACAVEAMAEAFALVRKYAVDPHVMHDVMTDGLFKGSGVYRECGADMIDGAPGGPHEISVARALEILDLLSATADGARVPMPSVDACRDRLLGAVAHGNSERSWTLVYDEQARASGLE